MSSWQGLEDSVCDVLGAIHVSAMDEAYTDDDTDHDTDADTDHDTEPL